MEADSSQNGSSSSNTDSGQRHGLMKRVFKRVMDDQKGIYAAPFKPSNIKWDVLFLAGTGALVATDRRIETHVPHSDFNLYQNVSNATLGSMSASLAGVWIYGIKTDHPHAKETGELELETLTNTFLLYAPMQLIAGRQRPGEGNGKGDFLQHHALNSSFPAGHAMFTWSMATVVAHEYPKTWVRILAYGAASTVAFSRFRARDHWASDTFVGMALGYAIGSHIFHTRCDLELSSSCHR
jgi:membrane-associated phospholipid phosphatase